MGLLDNLESAIGSGAVNSVLGSSSNPMAAHLLETINNHPGGLSGLIQSFHDQGLGGVVNSWVGTGQNLPILERADSAGAGQRAGATTGGEGRNLPANGQFRLDPASPHTGGQAHA